MGGGGQEPGLDWEIRGHVEKSALGTVRSDGVFQATPEDANGKKPNQKVQVPVPVWAEAQPHLSDTSRPHSAMGMKIKYKAWVRGSASSRTLA